MKSSNYKRRLQNFNTAENLFHSIFLMTFHLTFIWMRTTCTTKIHSHLTFYATLLHGAFFFVCSSAKNQHSRIVKHHTNARSVTHKHIHKISVCNSQRLFTCKIFTVYFKVARRPFLSCACLATLSLLCALLFVHQDTIFVY